MDRPDDFVTANARWPSGGYGMINTGTWGCKARHGATAIQDYRLPIGRNEGPGVPQRVQHKAAAMGHRDLKCGLNNGALPGG